MSEASILAMPRDPAAFAAGMVAKLSHASAAPAFAGEMRRNLEENRAWMMRTPAAGRREPAGGIGKSLARILGVAACLALAFGLWRILLGPETSGRAVETSRPEVMPGLNRMAGRPIAGILPEAPPAEESSDALVVPAGGYSRLVLRDGSAIEMNQRTSLRILPPSDEDAVLLDEGDLYCTIVKREAGARPFSIRTGCGHRVIVLGTEFEVRVRAGETRVEVASGRAVLEASDTERQAAGEGQRVAAGGARILTPEPEAVAPGDIAPWRPPARGRPAETLPEGLIFQDDFEQGLEKWQIRAGAWEIADGRGIGGSRALCVRVTDSDAFIVARLAPPTGNFEIGFHFSPLQAGLDCDLGFVTPDDRDARYIRSQYRLSIVRAVHGWSYLRFKVKDGVIAETFQQLNMEVTTPGGPVPEHKGLGILVRPDQAQGGREAVVFVDDFAIRRLSE